jgi:hypothetical protein
MKSRWFEYKDKAISLRQQGLSIREIETLMLIPRSTLSGWLKDIELTDEQVARLKQSADLALVKARVKASEWHRTQKQLRLQKAKNEAKATLDEIKIDDNLIELTLAMLYLGEGAKSGTTAIGNSDPLILKFFLTVVIRKYKLDPLKIRCALHLRADQDPIKMKRYWSKELGLPTTNFKSAFLDTRTVGRTTYPTYKGVCIIDCGNIAIQRKLIYLYKLFCQKVIDERAHSSVG